MYKYSNDLFGALASITPNSKWTGTVTGTVAGDYAALEWISDDDKPSLSEIEAEIEKIEAGNPSDVSGAIKYEYRRLRAPEYPPLTDLADAIFWQQQGDNSKMEAYVAACEAVKAKYPKPE